MHEIKQLLNYLRITNLKQGLLICPKESLPAKQKSRNIYIDGFNLKVISDDSLWGRGINL